MFSICPRPTPDTAIVTSKLFDQRTFYQAFLSDTARCRNELIVESPFITVRRLRDLLPVFRTLSTRGVQIIVNTKSPQEYEYMRYRSEAKEGIANLLNADVRVLYTGGHHRKLAVIDRGILWEGSLNILSQGDSCEIMRRIESSDAAEQMIGFTRIERFLR